MRIRDTIRFSLGNLRQRKLRTFLTMIGVAVGIGAIVLMVSFGVGLQKTLVGELEAGESLLEISVIPFKLDLFKGPPKTDQMRLFNEEDIKAIRAIPGVRAAWPELQVRAKYEVGKSSSMEEVFGTPDEAITEHMRAAMVAGDWWKGEGQDAVVPLEVVERARPPRGTESAVKPEPQPVTPDEARAFIGSSIKLVFAGGKDAAVPEGLTLEGPDDKGRRRLQLRVVGVYDEKKMGGFAGGLYVPLALAKKLRPLAPPQWRMSDDGGAAPLKEGEYLTINVKARSLADVSEILKRLDELKYPHITVKEAIAVVDKVMLALQAGLFCLGAIGIIVAFFGIANTMVMSILERTREIGMLKALGARNRDVRRVFFGEAAAIGLLGSLMGLGGGYVASLLMSLLARTTVFKGRQFADWDLFQVSWLLASGSVAFGVLVACMAGLLPAIRASRLDPVTALRHE